MDGAKGKDVVPLTRCSDLVLVFNTSKGRGVFAARDISAKTVIDVCPVLVLGIEENEKHIRHTSLYHYTYNWPVKDVEGRPKTAQAVLFGLGSMFNHATDQNVGWERDVDRLLVTYRTLRAIKAGEELCKMLQLHEYEVVVIPNRGSVGISYGQRLTFKDADAPAPVSEGDGSDVLIQIQLED